MINIAYICTLNLKGKIYANKRTSSFKSFRCLIRYGKRWTHIYNEYFKESIKSGDDLPLDCRIRNRKTWITIWQLYDLNATTIESTEISGSE